MTRRAIATAFLAAVLTTSSCGNVGPTVAEPAALSTLRVADPGPMTGYVRDCGKGAACVFGRPWVDTDGDGCDQRDQVLARDMTEVVRDHCHVISGVLHDPYTGTTVTASRDIQIDHVVPLAEAWRTGAATWPLERRVVIANDLDNLLAVQGRANQAKGDKRPDQWMPPNPAAHCDYARRYILIKTRYNLTVTAAERDRLAKALTTCPAT